ncbi:hypothetical protein FRB99_002949 [Tulasnella sp. 403]|nr:hypothetical protein FRB99_002949 [Tulasnella sp. 403]
MYTYQQITELISGQETKEAGVVYLQDESYEFQAKEGGRRWTVYGSPWSPWHRGSAFNYLPEDAERIVGAIPKTDILLVLAILLLPPPLTFNRLRLTHTPPHSIHDTAKRGAQAGCPTLLKHLGVIRPRLHVFGHIHEAKGASLHQWPEGETTAFVNAANYPVGKGLRGEDGKKLAPGISEGAHLKPLTSNDADEPQANTVGNVGGDSRFLTNCRDTLGYYGGNIYLPDVRVLEQTVQLFCRISPARLSLQIPPALIRVPSSPALNDVTMASSLSALTFASDATVVSVHGPDEYERTSYYNGITGDGDHPNLVYRSDFLTAPFPKPVGRHAHIPVKSLRGVFDTPLNGVWDAVGPQIRDLIKARKIDWSSVDPTRFFTHPPLGEEAKGSLGPVVIWVGVIPGSTSADTAHEVSVEILALLLKNGVKGVVVEWREAVPQRLDGLDADFVLRE